MRYTDFSELNGKTITGITGLEAGSEQAHFTCADGSKYSMHYEHACCASCSIADVAGDVADLIGSPLMMAEEVSNSGGDPKPSEYAHSWTWTFYKLRTHKGDVTIRWLGESNGYYSESVSFARVEVGE